MNRHEPPLSGSWHLYASLTFIHDMRKHGASTLTPVAPVRTYGKITSNATRQPRIRVSAELHEYGQDKPRNSRPLGSPTAGREKPERPLRSV